MLSPPPDRARLSLPPDCAALPSPLVSSLHSGTSKTVAANCRIRVAGRAKFRTRQELPRSEWPISNRFATRSASENELHAISPNRLNNPGKPYSPKRSCQVVNARDRKSSSQSCRLSPICNGRFQSNCGFSGQFWITFEYSKS